MEEGKKSERVRQVRKKKLRLTIYVPKFKGNCLWYPLPKGLDLQAVNFDEVLRQYAGILIAGGLLGLIQA